MMATTIMISTSVNPAQSEALKAFISCFLSVMRREQRNRRVIIITALFTNCLMRPQLTWEKQLWCHNPGQNGLELLEYRLFWQRTIKKARSVSLRTFESSPGLVTGYAVGQLLC
jgi:hypothetical protein